MTLSTTDGSPIIKLSVDETRARLLRQLGCNISAGLTVIGPARVVGAVPVKARQTSLL
jgi:hypothetical protein